MVRNEEISLQASKPVERLVSQSPGGADRSMGSFDGQKSVYLIVRNRSRFPVRIRAIEIEPKFIAILGGPENRSAFKARADVSFSATIAAESEREFPIVILAFDEKDQTVPVTVRVDRRSNRRRDAELPPINYRTSIEAITSMLNAQRLQAKAQAEWQRRGSLGRVLGRPLSRDINL